MSKKIVSTIILGIWIGIFAGAVGQPVDKPKPHEKYGWDLPVIGTLMVASCAMAGYCIGKDD